MADFCKQCANEIFNTDGDFVNCCTLENNENDRYAVVLCEGCGPILVNYLGECVSEDCLRKHKDGKLFHLPR